MNRVNKAVRADSWASALTEAQAWELYRKARVSSDWDALGKFAVAEYGIKAAPSRSAFYSWKHRMDKFYSDHLLNEAIIVRAEAAALAQTVTDKQPIVDAFAAAAATVAIKTDDHDLALNFANMALKFAEIQSKERTFHIQESAHKARLEEIALNREKWEAAERRLNAVKETVKNPELTPEKLKEELDRMFGREED